MASTFTWLDYSERDRRRALDVVDLFGQQETVDDLGIGTIRDALADLLFPGTSTIQTRARYFLFVPWMHLRLERRRVASSAGAAVARRDEGAFIEAVRPSRDSAGLIGSQMGEQVKRLAASVYWNGLGVWGIRLFPGSLAQYYRSLDSFYLRRDATLARDEVAAGVENWHPHLPAPPAEFPLGASFSLRRSESLYLLERLRTAVPETLLAWLASRCEPTSELPFVWGHPAISEAPAGLRELVEHARCFSDVMHGSALVYNLLLSQAAGNSEWVAWYREHLLTWATEVAPRRPALQSWDISRFWAIVQKQTRVSTLTQYFVEAWLALLRTVDQWESAADAPAARRLISDREALLKRDRARLANRRYLELWRGASGADRLDYRWRTTERLLGDIFSGLGETTDALDT